MNSAKLLPANSACHKHLDDILLNKCPEDARMVIFTIKNAEKLYSNCRVDLIYLEPALNV